MDNQGFPNDKIDRNFKLAEFLYQRFPESFKKAFNVWEKLDPYYNPEAPPTPFTMKEYEIPELVKAKKYREEANAFKKAANESDNHSDNYVLLSLVLSMVLFFSGMCGVAESRRSQRILLGTAFLIFVIAFVFIVTMPVIF